MGLFSAIKGAFGGATKAAAGAAHPGWTGSSGGSGLAKRVLDVPAQTEPIGSAPVGIAHPDVIRAQREMTPQQRWEQKQQIPKFDFNAPTRSLGEIAGIGGAPAGPFGQTPIGNAPDIPGMGNLSPTRPPGEPGAGGGFDQFGQPQIINGGPPPWAQPMQPMGVNPAWAGNQWAPWAQGAAQAGGLVPPQSSAYAPTMPAEAATNNPGWISGGRYGRRSVGR